MERQNTAGYDKVLSKAGLNGFDSTFVQGSTFVLRLNFCAPPPSAMPVYVYTHPRHSNTHTKKHTHNPVDDAKGNTEALLTMKRDFELKIKF